MHLDRKIRTVEVGLNSLGHPIQAFGDQAALERADLAPGNKAEPLRPRRGELGEQRGAELIDSVERGPVEQAFRRIGPRPKRRVKPGATLR
jgi:hypothetical protein